MTFKEFLELPLSMFIMKFNSIPESEPLHQIIKARTINIGKIKDKEERKYWRELKRINAIPDIYLSNKELDANLKEAFKNNRGGFTDGDKFR